MSLQSQKTEEEKIYQSKFVPTTRTLLRVRLPWLRAVVLYMHACVLSCFSRVWLCNPKDSSPHPTGSSVYGNFQARILEWVAMSSYRGSSQPRNQTHISCIASRFFTCWAIGVSQAMIRSLEFLTLPTHSLEKGGGLKMELMIYYAYVMKLP